LNSFSLRISKEEAESFANSKGMKYFEISSKNNDNIEQLFNSLIHEILNTPTYLRGKNL
jgi:hypothetical protein